MINSNNNIFSEILSDWIMTNGIVGTIGTVDIMIGTF